jgi:hypothetical protein
MMSMCATAPATSQPERTIAASPPLDVSLELVDPRVRPQPGELPLVIAVGGLDEGIGALLELPFIDIRLRDGSIIHAPLENPRIEAGGIFPSHLVPPRIAGVRWIGEWRQLSIRSQVTPQLTATQRHAVATGVASVSVDARISVWESHVSNTMPLVAGGEATADGVRTRIVELTPEDERSTLVVDVSSIGMGPTSALPWPPTFAPEFALINEARREAAPLQPHQSSARLDGLVLPGVTLRSARAHFGVHEGATSDTTLPDANWLRGARLMRTTSHFLGSYRVKLELKDWPSAGDAARPPSTLGRRH